MLALLVTCMDPRKNNYSDNYGNNRAHIRSVAEYIGIYLEKQKARQTLWAVNVDICE